MSCHLTLSTQHQTQPCRNINQIIILFSLSHELSIKINGERKDLDAHIAIINHGDIYEIENATHLVQLSIPIFYFYIEDTSFFNVTLTDIYCNQVTTSKHYYFNFYNKIRKIILTNKCALKSSKHYIKKQ